MLNPLVWKLSKGVFVKLGEKRVEEIIEIKLAEEEEKALRHYADAVQALVEDMKRLSE